MKVNIETNQIVPETDEERLEYLDLNTRMEKIMFELSEHNDRIANLGKMKKDVWDEFIELAGGSDDERLEGHTFWWTLKEKRFSIKAYNGEMEAELKKMQAEMDSWVADKTIQMYRDKRGTPKDG